MSLWTASTDELINYWPDANPHCHPLAILGMVVAIISVLAYVISTLPPDPSSFTPRKTLAVCGVVALAFFYAQWAVLYWPILLMLWSLRCAFSNDYEKPLDLGAVAREYKTTRVMDLVAEQQNRQLSKAKPPQ